MNAVLYYKLVFVSALFALTIITTPVLAQSNHYLMYIEAGSNQKLVGLATDGTYLYALGSTDDTLLYWINPSDESVIGILSLNTSTPGTIYAKDIAYYNGYLYVAGYSRDYSSNDEVQIILAIFNCTGNKPSLVQVETVGIPGTDLWANSVAAGPDGVFIAGTHNDGTSNGDNALLVKLGLDGSLDWAIIYASAEDEYGEHVYLANGYAYMAGTTYSTGAGGKDVFVVKINPTDGNIVWQSWLGGSDNDFVGALTSVSIEGKLYLYVIGTTESFPTSPSTRSNIYIAVLDDYGSLQEFKLLTGSGTNWGSYATVVDDKMFIAGVTDGSGAGGDDIIVYKLNISDNYNVLQTKTIGTSNNEYANAGVFFNNLIYLAGSSDLAGSRNPALLLYSPAITDLHWTNGETWENITVSEQVASAVDPTTSPSSGDPGFAAKDVSDGVTVNSLDASYDKIGYSDHLAVDNTTPEPIPEPIWVSLAIVVAVIAIVAFKFNYS